MKMKLKKLLCGFLAVIMIVSLMPMSAMAADESLLDAFQMEMDFASAVKETEPNNTKSNAYVVTQTQQVSGSMDAKDILDYAKFTLTKPARVSVIVTSTRKSLMAGLENSSDKVIAVTVDDGKQGGYGANDFYGDHLTIDLEAGTYYISLLDTNSDKRALLYVLGIKVDESAYSGANTNKTYSVTYDGASLYAENVPTAQVKKHGQSLTLSSMIPTREGYTFKEWNTRIMGTGDSYQPGDVYTVDKDVTLYAQWTEGSSVPSVPDKTYSVIYDGASLYAENVPTAQVKKHGQSLTLSSMIPTREGYTFKEWNTRIMGTGDSYQPGDVYTADKDVTLYAQWKEGSAVGCDHVAGNAVKENETAATCTMSGSYDSVVYCKLCDVEMSRTRKTLNATGHQWDSGIVTTKPTESAEGVKTYTCSACGETKTESVPKLEPVVTPVPSPKPENPVDKDVTRLSGKGRCDTAIAAADALKQQMGVEKFESMILASGTNFADALAGSYLAAVKSAPIMLFQKGNEAKTVEYIAANTEKVYLLGGTGAVSAEVEVMLTDAGVTVQRLAGKSRYDTNLAILNEAGVASGSEILVATAYNFADSLSASATGKPILLVNSKDGKLTQAQQDYLTALGGAKITILGGKGAVSEALEEQLAAYGEVNRLAGKSRYDTSTLIAKTYFDNVSAVVVAYGKNFPDGLCGGPLAYVSGAPLLLTAAKAESAAAAYAAEQGVTAGYVLGGTGALSEETVSKVFGN